MMKLLAAALMLAMPFTAFAELTAKDIKKEIAGQYRITEDRKVFMFIVRSNGTVEVPENQNVPFAAGRMSLNNSSNAEMLDGLPVAHIVIGTGSDEDVADYHVLLTAEQNEGENVVRLAAKFVTFNDGPNATTSVAGGRFKVAKYNKETEEYEEL